MRSITTKIHKEFGLLMWRVVRMRGLKGEINEINSVSKHLSHAFLHSSLLQISPISFL